jgi:hypothetical protein
MYALDYVLAVTLLTTPPEAMDFVEDASNPEMYTAVRTTLQAVAIEWEILDPREVRYILTRSEDFASDLKLLRRRYQDLKDAPPLNDCNRFPDRSTISDLLAFNRAYRQHLDSRQSVDLVHGWEVRDALQEADSLYRVWDTARDARCDYYYVTVRRQALKRLREMVGAEAYYTSTLPPHVPVWRFQRTD